MKNYVTSAVLKETPCMCLADLGLVAKLNTSKGIFIAIYKSIPTSLLRELASMKAGDKVDIFFRFESLQLDAFYKGKEQVKCFYDVKIHEGDIKRFKQCLWHERMPVIAEIDMFKAMCYLPYRDELPLGEDLHIEKIPSSPPSYFVGFILLAFLAILPVCGYLGTSFLIKMLVP